MNKSIDKWLFLIGILFVISAVGMMICYPQNWDYVFIEIQNGLAGIICLITVSKDFKKDFKRKENKAMSGYARIILEGPTSVEEVYNFIKEEIDPEATYRVEFIAIPNNCKASTKNRKNEYGYIKFNHTSNFISTVEHEKYPNLDIPMNSIEMSFDLSNSDLNVAVYILSHFGGYFGKSNTRTNDMPMNFCHLQKYNSDAHNVISFTYGRDTFKIHI